MCEAGWQLGVSPSPALQQREAMDRDRQYSTTAATSLSDEEPPPPESLLPRAVAAQEPAPLTFSVSGELVVAVTKATTFPLLL
nr:hypothetical protein Iba_chr07bCG7900 [Ipomoea batatas]GMD14593.1 hypothetical protein Iba_chr07bCG7910 [Ipomoea batatas]